MAKLVAIGDSLTQGFHSRAIARPTLSYPAMIAQSLKLEIPKDFPIPTFPDSGLPLNIEYALRSMESELGSQIDTAEWIFKFPILLRNFMNDVEDLYEGRKSESRVRYGGFYHNLAVFGFKVVDSYKINGSATRSRQRDLKRGQEIDSSSPMFGHRFSPSIYVSISRDFGNR